MTKATKAPAEKSARAKFPLAHLKPAELVTETQHKASDMKAHPNYAQSPEAQQAATALTTSAQTLSDVRDKIAAMRTQLVALETQETRAVAQCYRAGEKAVAVVNDLAGGSEEEINKWGFQVRARTPSAPTTAAPTGLRVIYLKTTAGTRLRWNGVRGQRGYLLQIGDGSPNGWAQTVHVGEPMYVPQGLTPGQHVSVRVAVIRKKAQSDWSDALSVLVR